MHRQASLSRRLTSVYDFLGYTFKINPYVLRLSYSQGIYSHDPGVEPKSQDFKATGLNHMRGIDKTNIDLLFVVYPNPPYNILLLQTLGNSHTNGARPIQQFLHGQKYVCILQTFTVHRISLKKQYQ